MLLVEELVLPNKKVVSLEIKSGETLFITGPNGSGKSLLLKSLAYLLPVTFRRFDYDGKPVETYAPEVYRKSVTYSPSVPNFPAGPSIEDYLRAPFLLGVYQKETPSLDLRHSLTELDLGNVALNHLSSGQRQSLSLLRLLTLKSKILLLDEPTSHLDPEKTRYIENLLSEWKERSGGTLVVVNHDEGQRSRLGGRRLPLETLLS